MISFQYLDKISSVKSKSFEVYRLLEFRFPIELTKHLISERFIIQKSILENKNSDVGFNFFLIRLLLNTFLKEVKSWPGLLVSMPSWSKNKNSRMRGITI